MDKVQLFNELAKIVKPNSVVKVEIDNLKTLLKETGIDSLDLLMFGIYLSDIYGVSEEVAKEFQFKAVDEMFDLFEKHATKTPKSIEEALEACQ